MRTFKLKNYLCAPVAFLLLAGIACALPAQAAGYRYTTIDYPGALCTSGWGINDSGDVLGTAAFSVDCSGTTFSFIYHAINGTFTVLPTVPGAVATTAIGINQWGVIVGSAGDGTATTDVGLILNQGAFTFFTHPGSLFTQGRAIGNSGIVTGYSIDSASNDIPFIYDPTRNSFIDITVPGLRPFPSFSVAQGINGKGEVVGSFNLYADSVYPGSSSGPYGFLRDKHGVITLFRVNGFLTRPRGITESGRIAGFLLDEGTGKDRGFVVTLTGRGGFQSPTVPDADLLDVPGSVGTIVESIDDLGRVSGNWTDGAGGTHGFLATPD